MTDQRPHDGVKLQALVLADHIYRDHDSGKYVIAGTFHQVNVPAFPGSLGKTVGIFISLSGLDGTVEVRLEFVDAASGEVLMSTQQMQMYGEDPRLPVELAVEVPPLPLPHAGYYLFRLAADGRVLGESTVSARTLPVMTGEADSSKGEGSMISLLSQASEMEFEDYNPYYVIQAVNLLQPLGKEAALEAISSYLKERDQRKDANGLFWVLRVLFDLPPERDFPPVRLGKPTIPPPDQTSLIPRFPIVVVLDIPLLLVRGYYLGGLPEPVEAHVAYFREHGIIREQPLAPPTSMDNVERQFLRQWQAAYGDSYLSETLKFVREQVARLPGSVAESR